MCGIAGIIGHIDDANRDALQRMNQSMLHRGPDGEGYWTAAPDSRGWGVMLAHRRLAILDISPAGAQPMIDPATGNVVVLNGEIYNYLALREQLTAPGEKFHSSGDTAVMLRALSLHGSEAVSWLRGMFAFAYWDTKTRTLLMARDPLGIKPLYFARNPDSAGNWSLIFASEVRAILASGLLAKPRLNPLTAASVVWSGFMVTPETAIAEIKQIWPGQWCIFDGAGNDMRQSFYWRAPPPAETPINEAQLAQTLKECVRLHLASDAPLGVFLSGGVDSSAMANLAQQTSSAPIHTFTLAFDEKEFDESTYARRIAEAIGSQHREVVLTEQHFIGQLDAALNSLDQPSFDGLNAYYIAHAVREAGFKVALAGTGGDELFGGYRSFQDLPSLRRWKQRTAWIPEPMRVRLAQWLASFMQPSGSEIPQQTRWAKLPQIAQGGADMLSLYQQAYALFLPALQQQLLSSTTHAALVDGLPTAMHSHLLHETQAHSPLSALSILEQRLFLGERLLRDTDAASMASSIEVRLPLVDQILFEQVNRLPEQQRYFPLGQKSILRRIGLRGLNPALFERPKSGFVMPFDRWIRTGLGKVMDQTLRDADVVKSSGLNPETVRRLWQAFLDGAPGIYWTRIWAIYVLIRWCDRNGVAI